MLKVVEVSNVKMLPIGETGKTRFPKIEIPENCRKARNLLESFV